MSTDAPSSPAAALPADTEQLQRLVQHLTTALAESSQTITQQQQLLDKLTHELTLLKRHVFGSRRERFATDDPRQKNLFEVGEPSPGDLESADSPDNR